MNIIPEAKELIGDNNLYSYDSRSKIVHNLCWFLPSQKNYNTLKKIAKNHSILDVGCGSGITGKYILETANEYHGVRTSTYSVDKKNFIDNDLITDISNLEQLKNILQNSKDDIWLLIWPPFDNELASITFKYFLRNKSVKKLIYIGEFNGCTGDEEFCDTMDSIHLNKHPDIDECNLHSWDTYHGIHDHCFEIIKKEKNNDKNC